MPAIIALTILTAVVPGTGRGFWLGGAVVASPSAQYYDYCYPGGNGRPADTLTVITKDSYWGVALLAGYAPAEWARFQLTLAELRSMWTGRVDLAFAPAVGLDFQVEPPVSWRVRPYAWAGGTWTTLLCTPMTPDTWFVEPVMTFNAGPGITVRITPRLSAFCETGLVGLSRHTEVDTQNGRVSNWNESYIAIERAKAGIRWYLP